MAKRSKPIHLIKQFGCHSKAVCDIWCMVAPIEATIIGGGSSYDSKGTFNPKKVTCKRCLKHLDYKEALDKVNNPLFYWKERT